MPQFVVKTNGSSITTVQTPAGYWQFSLFPDGIIKTTYIPVNSTHNEQVSDAVILQAERILPKIGKYILANHPDLGQRHYAEHDPLRY